MGHLLGYLLLILAINLLHDCIKQPSCGGVTTTVRRRLWSDSKFDCYSTTVSPNMLSFEGLSRRSRFDLLAGKTKTCHCVNKT